MLRSLYSGVAGLKTHQMKMDVIGNNIANVNTYAFKGSRVTFKDVYYQTSQGASDAGDNLGGTNSSQVGYGSMVGTIDVLHTRAGYTPTGRGMDVCIEGEGYLIAKDAAGNESYTRVGNLGFDGAGNLTDANGKYICGYPIKRDANGNIIFQKNTPKSGIVNAGGYDFSFGTKNGAKLNDYNIKFTTSTTTPATNDTTAAISGKTITINFDGTAIPTDTTNFADVQTALTDLFTALNTVGGPKYDANFPNIDIASVTVAEMTAGGAFKVKETGTIAGGIDEFTTSPELDMTGDPRPIKMLGILSRPDANGVPTYEDKANIAKLNDLNIGSDGIIRGTLDGNVIQVGQIILASIPNPAAMVMEGSSYFKAMANTGKIEYKVPGDKAVGTTRGGGLEMSNVDLSTEFADMITTQRGFQANSRIITVGDEMLQELVSMKR